MQIVLAGCVRNFSTYTVSPERNCIFRQSVWLVRRTSHSPRPREISDCVREFVQFVRIIIEMRKIHWCPQHSRAHVHAVALSIVSDEENTVFACHPLMIPSRSKCTGILSHRPGDKHKNYHHLVCSVLSYSTGALYKPLMNLVGCKTVRMRIHKQTDRVRERWIGGAIGREGDASTHLTQRRTNKWLWWNRLASSACPFAYLINWTIRIQTLICLANLSMSCMLDSCTNIVPHWQCGEKQTKKRRKIWWRKCTS